MFFGVRLGRKMPMFYGIRLGRFTCYKVTGVETTHYVEKHVWSIPWFAFWFNGFTIMSHYPGDPWWRFMNVQFSLGGYHYNNFTRIRPHYRTSVIEIETGDPYA